MTATTRKTAKPTVAAKRSGKYIDPEKIDWDASLATQEPNASAKAVEPEVTPSPEPEPTPAKSYSLTVPFAEAQGVPRHFWSSLGAVGGSAVATAHGVDVKADGKAEALVLTGPSKTELDKARKAVVKMWVDGAAASKTWRTNPEYKAASTQDRWTMLTSYLKAYADVAS